MSRRIQDEGSAQPFGFKRANQISQHRLQALNFVHERFAKDLTAALSAYLRTTAEVTLLVTTQTSYADFAAAAADPTCCSSFTISPVEKIGVVEVMPEATFSIIDRLLGGEGRAVSNVRPLTEIEKGIMQSPLKVFAEELGKAWKQEHPLDFRILETHTQMLMLHGIQPNEQVTLVEFQFRMNEESSRIRLAIPSQVLESVFRTGGKDTLSPKRAVHDEAMVLQLRRIPVSLSIETPETRFPVESIVALRVGDTLLLDQREEAPLLLKVAGKTKLQVQSRRDAKRKAFTIIARHRAGLEDHHEFNIAR
jgi:flagellar motor switch protein FliM